jgi:hypothetical protein
MITDAISEGLDAEVDRNAHEVDLDQRRCVETAVVVDIPRAESALYLGEVFVGSERNVRALVEESDHMQAPLKGLPVGHVEHRHLAAIRRRGGLRDAASDEQHRSEDEDQGGHVPSRRKPRANPRVRRAGSYAPTSLSLAVAERSQRTCTVSLRPRGLGRIT